ncbi:MAG TPA: phosphopantothenoylcysteine decarboxylase [Gemmata sp.]|jgi:phosphopantothenoylcysteine synthetase/decarboxylase|nr:phosphopantothenoylcysteine decarboxylase [Gemmata sp.]
MNFLITAGSTQSAIDRVRCVTSVFTGRTGTSVARTAWGRGHTVTLATSRPDTLLEYGINFRDPGERLSIVLFRTYDELAVLLQTQLKAGGFDVVCHAAAGGDYLPAGSFVPIPGTFFNARTGQWEARSGLPTLTEQKGGKIASSESEVWLRLVRGPKLIDRMRQPWGYTGILVKFQMQAGLGDNELIELSEASRTASGADLMVTTTLEAVLHTEFLGPLNDRYERVPRRELPDRLILAVESRYQERIGHG